MVRWRLRFAYLFLLPYAQNLIRPSGAMKIHRSIPCLLGTRKPLIAIRGFKTSRRRRDAFFNHRVIPIACGQNHAMVL